MYGYCRALKDTLSSMPNLRMHDPAHYAPHVHPAPQLSPLSEAYSPGSAKALALAPSTSPKTAAQLPVWHRHPLSQVTNSVARRPDFSSLDSFDTIILI